ncbi:MAG TPA: carboxypeptidase regulatory-like domain-containing protein, partial [Pyrinomonadaceae bacterium]|nr:carboxypeptidase regulatory-like domain-containing protein [Pyrinomonadaceae bacterium]
MSQIHYSLSSRLFLRLVLVGAFSLAAALWWAGKVGHSAAPVAAAAPQITSLSAAAATRSGRLLINGTGFGATQSGGRVEIGGVKAHVSRWSDTLISAYVAEATPTGSASVQVFSGGGASNTAPLEVTVRPAAADRIKWRFTMDADYAVTRPALGADGTIYVNDVSGALYALTPNGALKWIYRAGLRGGYGPVTVGGDGTIYVASLVDKPDGTLGSVGAIHAVRPDGTEKWVFNQTNGMIVAGPNVGPDGNIYAVTEYGIGLFALSPAGNLLYQRGRFFEDPPSVWGQEIVFGPAAMYFGFDGQSKLHSYSLGGDWRWSVPALAAGVGASFQAAVGPNGNIHVSTPSGTLTAYDPQGRQVWNFNESPNNLISAPFVGPDNAAYMVRNGGVLHALNPTGTTKWRFSEGTQLYDPAASPANDLVFMGGRNSNSGLSFFQAVSTADGQSLWKVLLAHEPGFGDYGQILPVSRPLFSADGQTAYIASDILGGGSTNAYSYFYAVGTAPDGTVPNTAPSVRMTGPVQRESFPHLSDITMTADASDAEGHVAKVEFYLSGRGTAKLVGTDTTAPYSAVAEDVPGDNYALYAVAYDDKGLKTQSDLRYIYVSYWPPTAELTSPANGGWFPAGSDVTLTAQADLRDGRISKMEFLKLTPNAEIICTVTAPPYTCVWRGVPAGVHTVFVRTFDEGTQYFNSERVTFAAGDGHTARHQIGGRASEPDGKPIAGATVWLERYGRKQPMTFTTTTTDANGRFNFAGLEPNYSYDVDAYHPEFSIGMVPVNGLQGLVADVAVEMIGGRPEPRPAGGPPVAWASYYGSPEGSLDGVTLLALDGQGNTLVTGLTGWNFSVVKYDPAGRRLWARVFDGGGRYQATVYDIAADAAGNVFVTGAYWGGTAQERNWVTIKYDAAGNELWRRTYDGPLSMTEYPCALEVDAAGNLYVVGEGGDAFDGGRSVTTIKYDPAGNVLWKRDEVGRYAKDVKLDAAGNAYVAGVSGGRVSVFKYDPNGNLLWRYAHSTGAADERADTMSLHLAGDGGVYVLADISDTSSPSASGYEPAVLKVNGADGQFRWVSHLSRKDGQRLSIATYAMDVDPAGNSYVTGIQKYNTDANVDAFTMKVGAADGAVQWMSLYAEPAGGGYASRWNADNNIAVDAQGNAYAYFTSQRADDDDVAVVKYRTDGTREWVHLFDNPHHTGDSSNYLFGNGRNILVDARGDIYFTGDSQVPGHSLDFVTVKLAVSSAGATPTPTPTPTPAPVTHAVTGKVTIDGSPAPGVNVALGGDQTATAQTDAEGNYSFAGLAQHGNYTVTPSLDGYDFTPGMADFTSLTGDSTADFSGTTKVVRPSVGMQYYPLPHPVRLLDTRAGEPACVNPGAPFAAGSTSKIVAQRTCSGLTIPANAESIVGNATVVNNKSKQPGYVTLFRGGTARPTVSSINYAGMQVISNAFTVGLGEGGTFSAYAHSTTDMIVDVTGYYAPPGAGGLYFHPLPRPARLLDTRIGQTACDAPGAPVTGGTARTESARVACAGVVIPDDALAIVGNATVVNDSQGSGPGYLTLYPGGAARPVVSNLNYNTGQVLSNAFTAGLGADGTFQIYAHSTTDVIVDVTGYYSASAAPDANGVAGLSYESLPNAVRLLDTRPGQPTCLSTGAPLAAKVVRAQHAVG